MPEPVVAVKVAAAVAMAVVRVAAPRSKPVWLLEAAAPGFVPGLARRVVRGPPRLAAAERAVAERSQLPVWQPAPVLTARAAAVPKRPAPVGGAVLAA